MKIGVDFDSVLSDLAVLQTVTYNIKHGTQLKKDDISDWWWWDDQPHPEFVWGPDVFLNKQWMLATPPVPGAIVGMRRLWERGHSLHIISDRAPHMDVWLNEWLETHRIPFDDIIISSKHFPKSEAYRQLGIDVGIDDAPHNIGMLAPLVQTMWVLDQPWNQGVGTIANVRRAKRWEDFASEYA